MARKKVRVAIAYDFDGTLAPGNMQEHSFLPEIGLRPKEFWSDVKEIAQQGDMDEILAYMFLMIKQADAKTIPVRRSDFIKHGESIAFFPGVDDWFFRIDQYAKTIGVEVDHYIISSGLRELIDGTKIRKHLRYVYASGFMYDANGVAKWPALAINYTTKTQYLFRINKGIPNSYDNATINKYLPPDQRPVPFSNMIYIGDGETDIPAMKMVKYQGGYSIAVYDPSKRKTKDRKSSRDAAYQLLQEERADFAMPADYRNGKALDGVVRSLISKIALEHRLESGRKQ
jgi:hypothetical protein